MTNKLLPEALSLHYPVSFMTKIVEDQKFAWKIFTKTINNGVATNNGVIVLSPKLDLRKSSKSYIPLILSCGECKSEIKVRRIKDFPNYDVKCKCKKTPIYLIKYHFK